MSLQKFWDHLKDPNPGFGCYHSSATEETPTKYFPVIHEIGKPASDRQLKVLAEKLGNYPSLRHFYEANDGVTLYRNGAEDLYGGVKLFSIEECLDATNDMINWYELMDLQEDDVPYMDVIFQGIAIGEFPGSANYFVRHKDHGDKVFYVDHDGAEVTVAAKTFDEFLGKIAADPPQFFEDMNHACDLEEGEERYFVKTYHPDVAAFL